MKKRCTLLLLLVAFCLSFPALAMRPTEAPDSRSFHIILLLDKSGSMTWSDPEHNAIGAAKMFVDSLYAGIQDEYQIHPGNPGQIKLDVIPFNSDPDTSFGTVTLNPNYPPDSATQYIDSIENEGTTDLGKAVEAAVNALGRTEDGQRKGRIVLFTDGYTDYADHPEKERLEAESADLLMQSLTSARRQEYVIYAIGLDHISANGNHRIREAGREEIIRIANTTQRGRGLNRDRENPSDIGVNYLITDSFQEIQNFYIDLFADMMDSVSPSSVEQSGHQPSAEGEYSYFNIPVDYARNWDSEKISCYNLYITSQSALGGIDLWDSSGSQISPSDSRISLTRDSNNQYAILSLLRPDAEMWRLGVLSSDGNVQVRVVPISGMEIETEALPMENGESVIKVRAFKNGQEQDASFYNGLSPDRSYCVIYPQQEETSDTDLSSVGQFTRYPLAYDPEENVLVGSVPVPAPGTYEVQAQIESTLVKATTEQKNREPIQYDLDVLPLELSVKNGKEVTADLNDALNGWRDQVMLNGEEVVWEGDPELKEGAVTLNGRDLTVEGSAWFPKTVEFTVRATDSLQNQTWEIPVTVEITGISKMVYVFAAVGIVLLIVLIVVIVMVFRGHNGNSKNNGGGKDSTLYWGDEPVYGGAPAPGGSPAPGGGAPMPGGSPAPGGGAPAPDGYTAPGGSAAPPPSMDSNSTFTLQ